MSIRYIDIDARHNGELPIPAELRADLDIAIIPAQEANTYQVSIDKCEIPTTKIPMFLNNDRLLWIERRIAGGEVERRYLDKECYTISEVKNMINDIIKELFPSGDPEKPKLVLDFDSDKRLFKFILHERLSNGSPAHMLYFSKSLVGLFNYLDNVMFITPDSEGNYQVRGDSPKTEGDLYPYEYTQIKPTYTGFYQCKAIRIFSTIGTEPYFIYDQGLRKNVRSNMLGSFIINSENIYGTNNLIYIPTVQKFADIVAVNDIKDFYVYFQVHYSNGYDTSLLYDKNEYLFINLSFHKKPGY